MKELKKQWKNGEFGRCYLFFGAETFLIREYESALMKAILPDGAEMMNHDIFEEKRATASAIIDAAETFPFLNDKRLITIKNSGLFQKGGLKDDIEKLKADPDFAKAILAIGRGGKKPRKDLAVWKDAKPYMGFFYDEIFKIEDNYDEKYDKNDIKATLKAFIEQFDESDDMNTWFDKIKAIGEALGYTSDMKAYKASPESFKGSVADISMFLRVAVTGKLNSPDMYAVMQILGKDRVCKRIENMLSTL